MISGKIVSLPSSKRNLIQAHGVALSISVVNQAVSSGTNFILGVYLARRLSAEQFGIYGIGFAAILFFSSVCNALLIVQMIVGYPRRTEADRDVFAATIFALLGIFAVALLSLAALLMAIGALFPGSTGVAQNYLMPITIASVACAFKDFFVRLFYSKKTEKKALLINGCIAFFVIAGFTAIAFGEHRSQEMNAVSALWILSIAYVAGAFIGACSAKLPLDNVSPVALRVEALAAWDGGRWATAGAVIVWLQSQVYVYVIAIFIGPAGVGHANAARLFIAPFQFLSPAVSQLVLPRLAAVAASGGLLLNAAKRYCVAMGLMAVLYLVLLLTMFPVVEPLFLRGRYPGVAWCVVAWGAVLMTQIVRESASTPLQALREFKFILTRNLLSVVVTLLGAIFLSMQFGSGGAVLSLAVGETVFAWLLWHGLHQRSLEIMNAN